MRKAFSPGRLVLAGLVLLGAAALIMFLVPSSDYLLLPDPAHPTAPLVYVQGQRPAPAAGGIYFVDVRERQASLLEQLFPGIREGATLVKGSDLIAPGTNQAQHQRESLNEMARSQVIAAAVALRAAGYKVTAQPEGALVSVVAPEVRTTGGKVVPAPAAGRLQPTDVIVAVDGRTVRTPADMKGRMRGHSPGDTIAFTVTRNGVRRVVPIRTVASFDEPSRPIVGVILDQSAHIVLPVKVRIDAGDVGGPSAGLAFALEVLEKLGRNVDHGYRVAATGEISLDGSVSPIGGVRQKVIGARKAGIDVFLVPAGDNYREASHNANGVRVISVSSFQQALHVLATLPPRQGA